MKYLAVLLVASPLLFLGIGGERIYQPPVITPHRQNPSTSRSAPTTRPGPPPAPPSYAQAVKPRQGSGEFLPQNLTFIISARGLKSKSVDPLVKVSNSSKNGAYEVLGRTEGLDNNKDPDFMHVFWIIWKKGTQQTLKFEVRDVDNLRRDDQLGAVIVDLDDYVAKGEKLNVTLQNGTGSLLIQKTTPVKFRLYARALPNMDLVGKSDPYVDIYWSTGSNGKGIKWAKSSVIENNENPDWNETFEFANHIKGTDQWLQFKVLDSDPTGADDLGEALLEVDPFVAKRQTQIIHLSKKGKRSATATIAVTPA